MNVSRNHLQNPPCSVRTNHGLPAPDPFCLASVGLYEGFLLDKSFFIGVQKRIDRVSKGNHHKARDVPVRRYPHPVIPAPDEPAPHLDAGESRFWNWTPIFWMPAFAGMTCL
jgi:hypothetical protein